LYAGNPGSAEEHVTYVRKRFALDDVAKLDKAVLFGTEQTGRKMLSTLRGCGVQVAAFADNDCTKWGSSIDGLSVIPPNVIDPRQPVIIASKYVREINAQLKDMGACRIIPHFVLTVLFPETFHNILHEGAVGKILDHEHEIDTVYELLADETSKDIFYQLLKFRFSLLPDDLPKVATEQYFPGDFWRLDAHERYVDVGAYDGDTLAQFLRHSGGVFDRYFALEPDVINYGKLVANIPGAYRERVTPLRAGAGACQGKSAFAGYGREDSLIVAEGTEFIDIVALDELCKGERVTTIKMDVEGYESEVLTGADGIIRSYKPKLAVCVYHRPQDLWELPLQVVGQNRGYKLYLRHHVQEIYDTVLYAV
jgi:FkbM family methyltransferase